MFAIDTFWKHAVAHNRLVMDAVLELIFLVEIMDAFVIHVFANDTF